MGDTGRNPSCTPAFALQVRIIMDSLIKDNRKVLSTIRRVDLAAFLRDAENDLLISIGPKVTSQANSVGRNPSDCPK